MRAQVVVGASETWIATLPESLKHEFSLEELEQMRQQFQDFDQSGDGSIAASELVQLMKSMDVDATQEEMQALIDKVDDNRSGQLEYPEFVRLVSEFRRGNGNKLSAFVQFSKLALAIRHELIDLTESPARLTQVFPVKDAAWEWNMTVRGPPDTPYEGGAFRFRVRFGREYPYEPPVLSCLTRIYHPNFVPMLNGTMSIPGLLDCWTPEWRMRTVVGALERVLAAPDERLMDAFQLETLRIRGASRTQETRISSSSPAKPALRHPRDMAAACVELFRSDREQFAVVARHMTRQCAAGSGV